MASCASCNERLVFENDDGAEVPDDLQLPCGCHFHWRVPLLECLFENAATVLNSPKCPSCGNFIAATGLASGSSSSATVSGDIHILTQYTNESGLQPDFDIYPRIVEEAFYEIHPELLPARAFLTMCSEGDVEGIMGLYVEAEFGAGDEGEDGMEQDGDNNPSLRSPDLLRYQDPLNNMESGLHVAIANDRLHVAYLLLYLASRAPLEQLPQELMQFVASIPRPEQAIARYADIRTLQTVPGETAQTYALRKGGLWADMAQRLVPS